MDSDLTVLLLVCCLPLLCLVIAGAGLAYWLISRKKKKDTVVEATIVKTTVEEVVDSAEEKKEEASTFRAGSIGEDYMQRIENKKKRLAEEKSAPQLEEKINTLVRGLWAYEDPSMLDPRDAMRFAGKYRGECANKLREIGKDAIPYLEPYAVRKEVDSLLEELKNL